MAENLTSAVKEWCSKNLSEKTIRELDEGSVSAVPIFKDFVSHGWLKYADIFRDKENLHNLLEIGEVVSGYSSVIGNMLGVNCVCALLLTTFGDDRQKAIGRKVLDGDVFTSFSLTEPDAGSDILNLKTTARMVDGDWVLDGKKYFATGADIADYILLVARTSTDKPVNRGISLFMLPRDSAGIVMSSQPKIATNGFASCEIGLDAVRLGQDAVIGGQDMGWGVITFAGAVERLMVAASCVGLSRRMLEYLYEYSQKRIIQGRPLYDIQLINHQLADMAIELKAAKLMVNNAIDLLISGATPTVEICGAKVFASEMQQRISMAAMRIVGGRGYLREYPIDRWMREGLLSLYAGGTNELQKNIIARKLHTEFRQESV